MSDFLLDSLTGDLKIANGDFVVGDTTVQEVFDIITSIPGFWKQYPNIGCSLELYQNGQISGLDSIIRKQLSSDGFSIQDLSITIDANGKLNVTPTCSR